jgi:hypothetical protein
MKQKNCFIIGLPETGKTTFLAALSYTLKQARVPTMLRWRNFNGDHQYLTRLIKTWLSGEKVARTMPAMQQQRLSLELIDEQGTTYMVSFPDLSGELFQEQYKNREMDKNTAEYIKNCESFMLFLNPEKSNVPEYISSVPFEERKNIQTASELDIENNQNGYNNTVPSAVQLVDILQFVDFLKNNAPYNLSIIVSAWDIIEERTPALKPEQFVSEQLPFLWQYIFSNSPKIQVRYYGVSAQGGTLEGDVNAFLLKFEWKPVERIIVVDNNGKRDHDITLPLWKVMSD